MEKGSKLYLLPTALSPEDRPHDSVTEVLSSVDVFICERIRTTRRWIRSVLPGYDIDSRLFLEYDKHEKKYPWPVIQKNWEDGKITALTSEAGTPAVADPGFSVVRSAHRHQIPVIPLPGNNSIILALMASGFDGNRFTFHGYFPLSDNEFNRHIKHAIKEAQKGYAQIYIETPYRNVKTFGKILKRCPEQLEISVSCDLLNTDTRSHTRSVLEWKKTDRHFLHKKPAIFIFGTSVSIYS